MRAGTLQVLTGSFESADVLRNPADLKDHGKRRIALKTEKPGRWLSRREKPDQACVKIKRWVVDIMGTMKKRGSLAPSPFSNSGVFLRRIKQKSPRKVFHGL